MEANFVHASTTIRRERDLLYRDTYLPRSAVCLWTMVQDHCQWCRVSFNGSKREQMRHKSVVQSPKFAKKVGVSNETHTHDSFRDETTYMCGKGTTVMFFYSKK